MMKTLIAGCAGFIGFHLTSRLLGSGREVIGIDSLNDQYDKRLKEWRLERLKENENFSFRNFDVSEAEPMNELFDDTSIESTFNLAARAGVRESTEDPHAYIKSNVAGTTTLLEACRRYDVGTYVMASTSSLYGAGNSVPFTEDADTDQPLSPYAATKKGAEAMAASYANLYDIDVSIPRYFTVYGPAGRPRMAVFRFIRWIFEREKITLYGEGDQKRDFTYVDDIVRGTIACEKEIDGYEILNLGRSSPTSLGDLIEVIEEIVGVSTRVEHSARHPADVDHTYASIEKAKELLEWEPKIPLREGVKRTVDWYQENRDWARDIDLGDI